MDDLALPVGVAVIAVLAAGARLSVGEVAVTPREVVSTILVAIFMAVVTYPYLLDLELSSGPRVLAIALLTFLAKDILTILLVMQKQIRKDPLGAVREFLNWRNNKDD